MNISKLFLVALFLLCLSPADASITLVEPPMDLTVECDGANNNSDLQNWLDNVGWAVANTTCDPISWTNDFSSLIDNCGATGYVIVTFIATDDCDDMVTTSAVFTIEDTTNPSIDVEASDMVVECDGAGNSNQINSWLNSNGGASASDLCGTLTWTNDFAGFADECGESGSTIVSFSFTDDCDYVSITSASFIIEDTTFPTIDIPANDLNLECDFSSQQSAINAWLDANGGADASDICGSSAIVWTNDYEEGNLSNECGSTGSVLVNFIATDNCGLQSTTSATINIVDTTDPIVFGATDIFLECDGSGNDSFIQDWLDANAGATAVDECSSIIWSNNYMNLTSECGATGVATVVFTATDECDNFATTEANIIIEDTTAPAIDSPASDIIIECDGSGNQGEITTWLDANGFAIGSDLCSNVTWTNDYEEANLSNDCGGTGSIIVVFTVTDDCGLSYTTDATITIEDTTPPIMLTQPMNAIVECDGAGNQAEFQAWLDSNGGGYAVDACGDVTWTNNYTPFANECAETGISSVNFIATDDCGNFIQVTATFTIEDTIQPSIDTPASDIIIECDGGNHQTYINDWLNNNGGASSSDLCGSSIIWTHDYVEGDENTECGLSGSVLVIFEATDECGLLSTTAASIIIEDTLSPIIVSPALDVIVECDGSGNDIEILTWLNQNGGAEAVDNCSSMTWGNDYVGISDGCGGSGFAIVTFTVTDDCGHSSSTQATFTIEDTNQPEIANSPYDLMLTCNPAGNDSEIEDWLSINGGTMATDFCGLVTWTNDFNGINTDCSQSQTVIVTFTVTDDCGNSSSANANLTVLNLCHTNMMLTGINSGDNSDMNNYLINDAMIEIISSQFINPGTDIKYNAGEIIEMEEGFEVPLGAIFEAYIEGCNN